MSALIRQMVSRKRAAAALEVDLRDRHAAIVAEAKGDTGPMPDHEWDGTKLRFQKPDGEWGAWVDLRGKRGEKGKDGERIVMVGGGGSGFDPSSVTDIPEIASGDEIVVFKDGMLKRVAVTLVTAEQPPANAITVNGQYVMVNGQYVVV